MNNHYRTLGVDPQAESAEIRSAYLALIRRHHPDKGGEDADAARAKEVTAAWDVLRDPQRRAAYDEARKARFQPESMNVASAGPRVRGGAAGRNLFLVLATGTLVLGWWALQQPHLTAPAAVVTSVARPNSPVSRTPANRTAEDPAIRPAGDAEAAARAVRAIRAPLLPDVRREPEVERPVVIPPLPSAEPVRLPVRTAERPRMPSRPPLPLESAELRAAKPRAREQSIAAVETAPRVDMAPLERHLQLLTDQSLRFGTEAKRSKLFSTREGFLKRLRDCDNDVCRRDAYLRRNQEVGEIMRN